jgi:hypothetical protein
MLFLPCVQRSLVISQNPAICVLAHDYSLLTNEQKESENL